MRRLSAVGCHQDAQFHWSDEELQRRNIEEQSLHRQGVNPEHHLGLQLQLPLIRDDNLELVPASYTRWDSEEEYRVRLADGSANRTSPLPGAQRMELEPGDALCFSPFGLHRGRYRRAHARLTLMVTYRRADRPLYSGQPWMLEPGFYSELSPAASRFYRGFADEHREAMEQERREAGAPSQMSPSL